jgi:hypothetical protein
MRKFIPAINDRGGSMMINISVIESISYLGPPDRTNTSICYEPGTAPETEVHFITSPSSAVKLRSPSYRDLCEMLSGLREPHELSQDETAEKLLRKKIPYSPPDV